MRASCSTAALVTANSVGLSFNIRCAFAVGLKESYKWWKLSGQVAAPDYAFEEQLWERARMGEAGTRG